MRRCISITRKEEIYMCNRCECNAYDFNDYDFDRFDSDRNCRCDDYGTNALNE